MMDVASPTVSAGHTQDSAGASSARTAPSEVADLHIPYLRRRWLRPYSAGGRVAPQDRLVVRSGLRERALEKRHVPPVSRFIFGDDEVHSLLFGPCGPSVFPNSGRPERAMDGQVGAVRSAVADERFWVVSPHRPGSSSRALQA